MKKELWIITVFNVIPQGISLDAWQDFSKTLPASITVCVFVQFHKKIKSFEEKTLNINYVLKIYC